MWTSTPQGIASFLIIPCWIKFAFPGHVEKRPVYCFQMLWFHKWWRLRSSYFREYLQLTPKGRSLVFGPFLKFRQAIVDAIFVQKISNFRWICGLVLASRRTNFYKILIFGLGIMPQKRNPSELRTARVAKKLFIFQLFWFGFFFINSLQSS
jgi:hypothetical protein